MNNKSQPLSRATRSYSLTAQVVFNLVQDLNSRRWNGANVVERNLANFGHKLLTPVWNRAKRDKWVRGHVYGRELIMPAEHQVVPTVAAFPHFNRPLALAVRVLSEPGKLLSIVDVGANIGETVAVIEQTNAGRCTYLCVEPDSELAEFCRRNHAANERVFVQEAFVGECKTVGVMLQDNGLANPSTKFSDIPTSQTLRQFDVVAEEFAEQHGIDLIKTDTEGFDFTILRSAVSTLRRYKPAVYFEWYPDLLLKLHESPESLFRFLEQFGYRYWVFFTARGELHCEMSDPTSRDLAVLAQVAINRSDINYFDVFGSTEEPVSRALTDLFLRPQQSAPISAGDLT